MSLPGRLVELASGRLYVHTQGSGPPLVLLHGYLVSHWYYRAVIPRLAERFEVIAIDLPGQGESDRPPPERFSYDLPSLADTIGFCLDALGKPRVRIAAHSMGGGVAITLAARQPQRVERLVLEDAAIYPLPMPIEGKLALLPGVGKLIFKSVYARRDLARHLRSVYKDPALATDELIDYYWERFNRAGARDANYALLRMLDRYADNTGDPGRIQCPTLLVWGEEDRAVPLAHGKRLVKQIPGARLEVIGSCGHSPHEERPDEYLRVVLPFLDGEARATDAQAGHG
jgi:pimeloyl-ACP methyl ester carboxylesterase